MIELLAIPALIAVLVVWIVYSILLNRRLNETKARYRQFFSDAPLALIVIDKYHRILEWNQTAEIIFGWKNHDVYGENIIELIVPAFDHAHVLSILHKAYDEGISYSKNYNITEQGSEIFCEWRNRRLEGRTGEIVCMAQDITVSQKTLDALNKRSTALESAGDAIFYTDSKGLIEFANHSFFALELDDQNDIYGTHIGRYLFKERLTFNTILSQFDANHTWRGTVHKSSPHGDKILSVTLTAIYHRSRLVSYIANLHDITQIASHVDDLTHRVLHDPLTGALNRHALDDRLTHAINRSKRSGYKIALFFVDLNDFKLVNDCYGHEAGDRLLRDITENIRGCLRTSDTVCRYGGDEFVIVIEDIKNEEHLQTVHDIIQSSINEPVPIDATTVIKAQASIGAALYPDHASDAEGLIKAADVAMYIKKKEKKLNEPAPTLCVDNRNH